MSREIIHTDDFVKSASTRILQQMESALKRKPFFALSLCGGSTPYPVYERMAGDGGDIPWDRVIITFGDERCVPPDHEQSNFRAAKARFLDNLPIPSSNILRIKGELAPEAAASDYEEQLDTAAKKMNAPSLVHDLVLLGMGDDGHTASLFPGTAALAVADRRVAANYVPKLNAHRITLTIPYINRSRFIMFLVNDAKKRNVVEAVLAGREEYPAAKIKPEAGDLIWILGGEK